MTEDVGTGLKCGGFRHFGGDFEDFLRSRFSTDSVSISCPSIRKIFNDLIFVFSILNVDIYSEEILRKATYLWIVLNFLRSHYVSLSPRLRMQL